MGDFADEASRIEYLHREAALAAQRAKADHPDRSAASGRGADPTQPRWCLDCGERIPAERLRIFPMAGRCTSCLSEVERQRRNRAWMA